MKPFRLSAPASEELTAAIRWYESRRSGLGGEFHDAVVHQTFIPCLNRRQVAESRCGYGGSNKAVSVERNFVWKEQLLEPLPLFERRLHPEVGGARQNAFCERQDALYVEFIELA